MLGLESQLEMGVSEILPLLSWPCCSRAKPKAAQAVLCPWLQEKRALSLQKHAFSGMAVPAPCGCLPGLVSRKGCSVNIRTTTPTRSVQKVPSCLAIAESSLRRTTLSEHWRPAAEHCSLGKQTIAFCHGRQKAAEAYSEGKYCTLQHPEGQTLLACLIKEGSSKGTSLPSSSDHQNPRIPA